MTVIVVLEWHGVTSKPILVGLFKFLGRGETIDEIRLTTFDAVA
jgi:hypothetical protein